MLRSLMDSMQYSKYNGDNMTAKTILYGYSGFNCYQQEQLQKLLGFTEDITLILLEDAVNGVQKGKVPNPYQFWLDNNKTEIFCVKEDYIARGFSLDAIHDGIQLIDYDGLIKKIEESGQLMSWL